MELTSAINRKNHPVCARRKPQEAVLDDFEARSKAVLKPYQEVARLIKKPKSYQFHSSHMEAVSNGYETQL